MRNGYVLEERLYKTEDGEVVREGDPRAAYVYRGPGRKIPMEEAKALGLVGDTKEVTEAVDDDSTEGGEDLSGLKRPELDVRAKELGIEEPEKLKKKDEVITAIEAAKEALAVDDDSTEGGEESGE